MASKSQDSGSDRHIENPGQDGSFALLGAAMRRVKSRVGMGTGCGVPQRLIETCFGCDDERTATTAPVTAAVIV